MISALDKITQYIANSKYLVVFTGAGVSTASGLPDYRGPNGIWTLRERGIQPKPALKPWYEFEPNEAHYAIKELQDLGLMKFLISQNVDGLHLKSGISKNKIAELHGNASLLRCIDCDQKFHLSEVSWDRKIHGKGYLQDKPKPNQPDCLICGGRLASTVVNFGNPLPREDLQLSRNHSLQSDVFLVLGSSLSVYPASSMPKIAANSGSILIIINQGKTEMDNLANIRIDGDVSFLLPKIVDNIKNQSN